VKTHYTPAFKQSIVQKVLMPGGPSVMETAEKNGIHHTSIRNWIKSYASTSGMKKSNDWTPEKKLEVIIKTAAMTENQRGEFLRSNGLHSSELEQWKQDFYSSQQAAGRPRVDPEVIKLRNKEKELSKDLRRKDRALAEMSARVILLKKNHLIFGETEDDE
jgi:transposase-like protein